MLRVSSLQTGTALGGKDLSDMLVELYVNNTEVLDRSELTPNMLTPEEITILTHAGRIYYSLLDKLDGEVETDDNSS